MSIAYIGRKGQITLPKEARKVFGLQERDSLIITIEEGRIVLRPVLRRRSLPEFKGVFAGRSPFRGRQAEKETMEQGVAEQVQAVTHQQGKNP